MLKASPIPVQSIMHILTTRTPYLSHLARQSNIIQEMCVCPWNSNMSLVTLALSISCNGLEVGALKPVGRV